MTAQGNQIVRARLGALIAHDAGLGARLGLHLQTKNTAEPWRHRAPLGWILEREGRLRRVLEREPETLEQVDEEDGSKQFSHGLANQRRFGLAGHDDALLAEHRVLFANLILQAHQPVEKRFGPGGHPDTYTSTG